MLHGETIAVDFNYMLERPPTAASVLQFTGTQCASRPRLGPYPSNDPIVKIRLRMA